MFDSFSNELLRLLKSGVAWKFFEKGLRALGSPASAILIALVLSAEDQGYMFSFLALLGGRLLFEAGIGQVFLIYLSRETNGESINDLLLSVDSGRIRAIGHLANGGLKFLACSGSAFFLSFLLFGFYVFSDGPKANAEWFWPYILMLLVLSLELVLSLLFIIYEAFGNLRQTYTLLFVKALIFYSVYIVSLTAGLGLFSFGLAGVASLLVEAYLWCSQKELFQSVFLVEHQSDKPLFWMKELLPFQLRVAGLSLTGFLSFHAFTPLLFKVLGPEEAGQFGLTITLIYGTVALSISFVQVSMRRFAILAERKDWVSSNRLMLVNILVIGLMQIGFLLIFFLAFLAIERMHPAMLVRFVSVELALGLFLAVSISTITQPLVTFLRSHKREPFFLFAICNSTLTVIFGYLGAIHLGVSGPILAMTIVSALSLPIILLIFFREKRDLIQSG
jgi:O-antigen/teichoic acid export membrane protein